MLNSSQNTRDTAKIIHDILVYYVHPTTHRLLIDALLSILKLNPAWPEPPKQFTQIMLKQIQKYPVEEVLLDPEKILGSFYI